MAFRIGDRSAVYVQSFIFVRAFQVVFASYAWFSIFSDNIKGLIPEVTLLMSIISEARFSTVYRTLGVTINWISVF